MNYEKSKIVKNSSDQANRELRLIKTLNAPVHLVWKVWTNPEYLANWWGPEGFSNTIVQMDFREGGEWKLTMHGPDGKNYPNRSVYREIELLEKIVFEHFNPDFVTTVLFESNGDETRMDWSLLFETEEMYEIVVKAHKADEGQQQNVLKLEKYLADLRSEMID